MFSLIMIWEFIERHSKAKHTRAAAYSWALWRIKGVVQRVVHGKLRSDIQRVRADRVTVQVVGEFKTQSCSFGNYSD